MRQVTNETQALIEHLKREFGGHISCPKCPDVIVPPVGMLFEVVDPLKTEPHPIEESRWAEKGLTKDQCIPPGIYGGIEEPGIIAGTSTHSFCIGGSEEHGTGRVCVRLVSGNIDWRGVKAVY